MEISPPTLDLRVRPSLLKTNTTDGWASLINVPIAHPMVIGIDASLKSTGVAILYNGRIKTIRLCPPKGYMEVRRLAWYYTEMLKIISQYGSPHIVGIEGYAMGAKFQTHQMGELGGVLRLVLYSHDVPYMTIPPTKLKAFVCGGGKADKQQVSKDLFKRFGVDLSNNDEVDAAGIAIMTLATAYSLPSLLERQKNVIRSINK